MEIDPKKKYIMAFVGMPGAGKSVATSYLESLGYPRIRFGQVTDDGLKAQGLDITPENEQRFRENIREQIGMNAYAQKVKPSIDIALEKNDLIILDGLYSWEEYLFLKEAYSNLILVHIYTEPKKRYSRLSQRSVRPFTEEETEKRDIAELENLNKGGPIAIADYLVKNDTNNLEDLYKQIDDVLQRILNNG